MSRFLRVVCGLLAVGFCWVMFEMVRAGKPLGVLPPVGMVTLAFAFYAIRGRRGSDHDEPGAIGMDRSISTAQVIIYLVLVVAAFVVLFLVKSQRL